MQDCSCRPPKERIVRRSQAHDLTINCAAEGCLRKDAAHTHTHTDRAIRVQGVQADNDNIGSHLNFVAKRESAASCNTSWACLLTFAEPRWVGQGRREQNSDMDFVKQSPQVLRHVKPTCSESGRASRDGVQVWEVSRPRRFRFCSGRLEALRCLESLAAALLDVVGELQHPR